MIKHIISILLATCLLAGCAPKFNASSPLFWGNWVLSELDKQPVQMSGTESDAGIHFEWNDTRANGFAGCNRFNTTFTADTRKMQFGDIATTRTTCPNQAFEDKYLKMLADTRQYSIDKDMLYLKNGNGTVLAAFMHRK